MIKIIDGKRYNTETATLVYEHSNRHCVSDFKHRCKTLYRTKKGKWFLHHVGGAMTDMAISVGGGTGGSASIEPIDDDDAFRFLEAHSSESEALAAIEECFPDRIDDA